MPDYGLRLAFGANADPLAADPGRAIEIARVADRAGLDVVGMQDHPYNRGFLDTWTLLATLAARTERVHFFPDVANLPLRPPAMLAKAAATLDALSGGRVELGLGAGAFWPAIRAMGGPARTPGDALAALEEAIEVIRRFWSGQRGVRFTGRFYSLDGAQPGPRPAHPIGLWLGVTGPRALALAGRLADGVVWSTSYVPPERVLGLHERVDEAAVAAGRTPQAIRRIYNVMGQIQPGRGGEALVGPIAQWTETLAEYALRLGMDTFVFWPLDDHLRQVAVFAEEVVPAVRAAVERERATTADPPVQRPSGEAG